MKPFEAYQWILSTKLHFSSDSYNMIEQGGRVNAKEDSFNKKGLRFAVMKLAKKYTMEELVQYVMANVLAGDKQGGLFGAEGERHYLAWKKRIEGLSYFYEQDLKTLADTKEAYVGDQFWTSTNGQHPQLLREYLAGNIMLETLVILNMLYKYTEQLDADLSFDPVWKNVSKLIRKYSPFIQIEVTTFQSITKTVFD